MDAVENAARREKRILWGSLLLLLVMIASLLLVIVLTSSGKEVKAFLPQAGRGAQIRDLPVQDLLERGQPGAGSVAPGGGSLPSKEGAAPMPMAGNQAPGSWLPQPGLEADDGLLGKLTAPIRQAGPRQGVPDDVGIPGEVPGTVVSIVARLEVTDGGITLHRFLLQALASSQGGVGRERLAHVKGFPEALEQLRQHLTVLSNAELSFTEVLTEAQKERVFLQQFQGGFPRSSLQSLETSLTDLQRQLGDPGMSSPGVSSEVFEQRPWRFAFPILVSLPALGRLSREGALTEEGLNRARQHVAQAAAATAGLRPALEAMRQSLQSAGISPDALPLEPGSDPRGFVPREPWLPQLVALITMTQEALKESPSSRP